MILLQSCNLESRSRLFSILDFCSRSRLDLDSRNISISTDHYFLCLIKTFVIIWYCFILHILRQIIMDTKIGHYPQMQLALVYFPNDASYFSKPCLVSSSLKKVMKMFSFPYLFDLTNLTIFDHFCPFWFFAFCWVQFARKD